MFFDEDIEEIFQAFPAPEDTSPGAPSLVLSSDRRGFVTLRHLKAELRNRGAKGDSSQDRLPGIAKATPETQKVSIYALARNLEVEPEVVIQLIESHPNLALLSLDRSDVIASNEREVLQRKLSCLLLEGLVLKLEFATQNDLDIRSVDFLLGQNDGQLVHFGDWVCSKAYEKDLSEAISRSLRKSLREEQPVKIVGKDLPGTPPIQFAHHTVQGLLRMPDLAQRFHVQEDSDNIRCVPKQLTEQKRDALVSDLQSGALAYINLQAFWKDFPELFPTFEQAHDNIEKLSGIEIIDNLAVSSAWLSEFVQECVQILDQDGLVHLMEQIDTNFPASVRERIMNQVVGSIVATLDQPPSFSIRGFIITIPRLNTERHALLEYAKADAVSQWRKLKGTPENEIKFNLSDITKMVTSEQTILHVMAGDKAVQKAVEEQFWTTVSEQEVQNEAEFSAFWAERVISRCHIYSDGLVAVDDQKLRDQMAELFASYAQKELLPDSISKARSQGLVLSRKTRKNLQKLETKLTIDKMDAPSIVATIDRFNKKQTIKSPDLPLLREVKEAMIQDMKRRMQKQKKSDGPVLFLTLVILLFAKHYPGVVYATGKFAPKLLKQLKSVLEVDHYDQLEKWKEAAKSSTLTAEDREEMKKMVEA